MLFSLLFADTALGRIDITLLSQQTKMELLIEPLPRRVTDSFDAANEVTRDACEWLGVTCSADRDVIEISWTFMGAPHGLIINLVYLPDELHKLNLFNAGIGGEIETDGLPPPLENLQLACNRFFGTLALNTLPAGMTAINVEDNRLEGSLDLTSLPPRLVILNLGCNNFSGEVLLQKLPERLHSILLRWNSLKYVVIDGLGQTTQVHVEDNEGVAVIDVDGKVCKHAQVFVSSKTRGCWA